MSGIFAIVGPSGVGKDTLMHAAQARIPGLRLVRRVVTRCESSGGEDFEGVSEAEFDARRDKGAFALHWRAHGLSYGIPVDVEGSLSRGETVLFNGSRAMLGDAMRVFPALKVIHVTARPDVLAERLRQRGRESDADIAQRLVRARLALPEGLNVAEIDNSGALEDAVKALVRVLDPEGVGA